MELRKWRGLKSVNRRHGHGEEIELKMIELMEIEFDAKECEDEDGDLVMEDQELTGMEKDAGQAVVEVTVRDIDMEVAHTPCTGPSWWTDETMGVTTVLHTPLLCPTDIQISTARSVACKNSVETIY